VAGSSLYQNLKETRRHADTNSTYTMLNAVERKYVMDVLVVVSRKCVKLNLLLFLNFLNLKPNLKLNLSGFAIYENHLRSYTFGMMMVTILL
jgi:hypothetical protein